MNTKIQYANSTERKNIIESHTNLFLIEDAQITEGNFLTFTDIKPVEYQVQDINNTANMILLKQEGVI